MRIYFNHRVDMCRIKKKQLNKIVENMHIYLITMKRTNYYENFIRHFSPPIQQHRCDSKNSSYFVSCLMFGRFEM